MPISRIQSTTIFVTDPEAAVDFYVNRLGFELRTDQLFGPNSEFRWLEVAPPDGQAALILASGYGGWSPERVGVFTGIVLSSDAIETTYEDLVARGVQFIEVPTLQAWGMKQAQFADQDGNIFVLVGQ